VLGVLIELVGFGGCYYLLGVTYGLASLLMFMIRPEEAYRSVETKSFLRSFLDGLKYLWSNKPVRSIILIEGLYDLLIMPTTLGGLLDVFTRNVLNLGAVNLGLLFGISGIGSLVASIGVASLGNFKRKGWLYVISCMSLGFVLIFLSGVRSYSLALVVMVMSGFTNSLYNSMAQSLTMLNVPDEMRGRVVGVKSEIISTILLGNIYFGGLAGSVGAPFTIMVGGVSFLVLVTTIIFLTPNLRRLE